MNHPKKQFKGVWIPKEIWEDTRITWLDKALLAEIWALSDDDGCFASNEYLAAKFGVAEVTMKNKLSILRKNNYIRTVRFDGRRRWIKVCWDSMGEVTPGVTAGVTKSVTPDVTENMTPEVTESVTPHYIEERKDLEHSGSRPESPTTTTNFSSDIDWEGNIYCLDDVPDKVIDSIERIARARKLSEDDVRGFVLFLEKGGRHVALRKNESISGLTDLIDIYLDKKIQNRLS